MTTTTAETLQPPTAPREWSLAKIEQVLSRPLPPSVLRTKEIKGNKITYLPWYAVNRILTKYCPGWTWEITKIETTQDRVFLVGRLTIPTSEGNVYRESSGTELLKDVDKNGKPKEIAYGNPVCNAEAQALRRAAAKFGLGLNLYDK